MNVRDTNRVVHDILFKKGESFSGWDADSPLDHGRDLLSQGRISGKGKTFR